MACRKRGSGVTDDRFFGAKKIWLPGPDLQKPLKNRCFFLPAVGSAALKNTDLPVITGWWFRKDCTTPKSPSFLSPPRYVKHKASGQAVVYQDGRTVYLGKYGSAASKETYKRLVAEWTLTGGLQDSRQEITVAEIMAAYVAHAKRYYRKAGKVTSEYGLIVDACRVIKPLYGRSLAVEFGPLALKTVRQSLIDSGLSRKGINRQVGRVKRMFRWAAAEELIPAGIPQALIDRSVANEPPPQSIYETGGHELRRWQGYINYAAVNKRWTSINFRLGEDARGRLKPKRAPRRSKGSFLKGPISH
jgi:hypothetical protein